MIHILGENILTWALNISIRMSKLKTDNSKVAEFVKQSQNSYNVLGTMNKYKHFGQLLGISYGSKVYDWTKSQKFHTSVFTQKENMPISNKDIQLYLNILLR